MNRVPMAGSIGTSGPRARRQRSWSPRPHALGGQVDVVAEPSAQLLDRCAARDVVAVRETWVLSERELRAVGLDIVLMDRIDSVGRWVWRRTSEPTTSASSPTAPSCWRI